MEVKYDIIRWNLDTNQRSIIHSNKTESQCIEIWDRLISNAKQKGYQFNISSYLHTLYVKHPAHNFVFYSQPSKVK